MWDCWVSGDVGGGDVINDAYSEQEVDGYRNKIDNMAYMPYNITKENR